MRRWIPKLVLFLLLGAIVNVAVAWGCVLLFWDLGYRGTVTHTPHIAKELSMRYNPVASEIPVAVFEGWEEIYLGHRFSVAVVNSELSLDVYTYVVSAGWPIYSMRGVLRFANGDGNLRSLWLLPWEPRYNPIAIPLRPIWPGFAINTVFYAAILWLLMFGVFTTRSLIRRKRGHCIKCSYDLRGAEHEACPECGVEVS